ncbi:hypothetical protein [Foetidibacter luteolus]|uniref:hypothetical protein n=1 Tax=Foetidibacter luteolus TaxID=2608880 RepID=UPI00129B0568|nr:hypothetical protein [Foetidibacter luteolus]
MKSYDYPQTDLSRSILGGLFTGMVATFANLIFIFIFRRIKEFYVFNVMDVGTIIFGTMILMIVCGVIFYFFVHYLNKGITFYRIAVFLFTSAIVFAALAFRPSEIVIPGDFRAMFIGTQLIIGGLAAFLIPYLFRHDSIIS